MPGEERYSKSHIKKGLMHFLLGKVLSSIGGIVYLLLLVRELEVAEFGAYSVLTAFVELFTALTGFGLTHILLRYAPELHVQKLDQSLKKLLMATIGLRAVTLIASLGVAYAFGLAIAGFFELAGWIWAYEWFLVIVFLRATRNMVFQAMESLLQQKLAQRALVIITYLKLVVLAGLLFSGHVGLKLVIFLEIASEMIGLVLMVYWHMSWLARISSGVVETGSWITDNLKRMAGYGAIGYVQHLAIMLYGSSPNRLVASRYLPVTEMATFGFAQALIDMVKRYLPAQMLAGFVRPIFISRYTQNGDFGALVKLANLVLKTNFIVLSLIAVPMLVSGPELFSILTKGKYSDLAAVLFTGMLGVMALESQRHILDLLLQTVEKNRIQVVTNLILSSSIMLSLFLIPKFGAASMLIANALGLVVSNMIIIRHLGSSGLYYSVMKIELVKIFFGLIMAVLAGNLLNAYVVVWFSAMVSFVLMLVFMVVVGLVSKGEINMLGELRRK
ncbi:MAG: hypothetical protein B7Y41_05155 [Hydrogenophilales bacterium 28-61-23]|nr:MAG: hypothetical protein B7Y41_05155 [Hydrogenophilales bacterium 28-61-23]